MIRCGKEDDTKLRGAGGDQDVWCTERVEQG